MLFDISLIILLDAHIVDCLAYAVNNVVYLFNHMGMVKFMFRRRGICVVFMIRRLPLTGQRSHESIIYK